MRAKTTTVAVFGTSAVIVLLALVAAATQLPVYALMAVIVAGAAVVAAVMGSPMRRR